MSPVYLILYYPLHLSKKIIFSIESALMLVFKPTGLHLYPLLITITRFYYFLNESHAANPIRNSGEVLI